MRQDFHGDTGQVAGEKIVNRGGNTRLELNIQGDNYGSISMGGQGHSDEGRPLHLASRQELTHALAYWRAQWWSGFRGFWFNLPCILMLVLILGIVAGLLTGVLVTSDPQQMWMLVIPMMAAILGCGLWMNHIRRIEERVMAESRAAIDAIRTELRKRR
ncbi:hypothetical protein [Pseudomonas mosselii]|uniref:Uncharacterized protein n=1 Tax=Pseudomonas mosselii TaxID=78327 RepID=A0ABX9B034_9PSED|nr:hypothetical protein [Pseudomonas mosselii]QZP26200.1 hypothetical protein K5H97_26005 [Pseudomonas mosselii]